MSFYENLSFNLADSFFLILVFFNRKANFTINQSNGEIKVRGKLDRESMEDENIKVVVIATDHGQPSLTGTTEVTVEVKDINDNCPYFYTQDLNTTYVFKELVTPRNFHQIQVDIHYTINA